VSQDRIAQSKISQRNAFNWKKKQKELLLSFSSSWISSTSTATSRNETAQYWDVHPT
jgi:hypothetical protein